MERITFCILINRRSTLATLLFLFVSHSTEINLFIGGAVGTMAACFYLAHSSSQLEQQVLAMRQISNQLQISLAITQHEIELLQSIVTIQEPQPMVG